MRIGNKVLSKEYGYKYEAQALKAFQIKITLFAKQAFLGVKENSLASEHLIYNHVLWMRIGSYKRRHVYAILIRPYS